MADIEPPSFSLGLDLSFESDLQTPDWPSQAQIDRGERFASADVLEFEDEDEQFTPFVVEIGGDHQADAPRVFKRLKRGPDPKELVGLINDETDSPWITNDDDDIEEFSPPHEFDERGWEPAITEHSSICSSSKVPLHGHLSVARKQSHHDKPKEKEMASYKGASSSSMEKCPNGLLPNVTTSPPRKFQLLDSDSDDIIENHQTQDLWNEFLPSKNFHVPTPVLDEVCDEYFHSLKDKNMAQIDERINGGDPPHPSHGGKNVAQIDARINGGDPPLPSHRYFFHNDPMVQKLVSSRLPNFFPLGMSNNGGHHPHPPCGSVIDYQSQFNEHGSKLGIQRINNNIKAPTKGGRKSKQFNTESIPKDVAKHRVHADGQPAGHWYTSPEGRKVYVSKNGQELAGSVAYRQYKKEIGGMKKAKKKPNAGRKKR